MTRKITWCNSNCEYNDVENDSCELDSLTIGASGVCVEVSPAEEQKEQKDEEAVSDTTEEDR